MFVKSLNFNVYRTDMLDHGSDNSSDVKIIVFIEIYQTYFIIKVNKHIENESTSN